MNFSIPILVIIMALGSSEGTKDDSPCPGDNITLILNTSKPFKYCQWGGTEGKGPDAIPLDMSVRNVNEVTNANTTLSQRGYFVGNLSAGVCAFVLTNFQQDDRKDHRVSGLDVGNTYRKEEYKITPKGNCTNSTVTAGNLTAGNSSAGNSTAGSTAAGGPDPTNKTTVNDTGTYPANDTKTLDDTYPANTWVDAVSYFFVAAIQIAFLLIVPARQRMMRRQAQQQPKRKSPKAEQEVPVICPDNYQTVENVHGSGIPAAVD